MAYQTGRSLLTPVAILEAMAQGVPTVATDVGGVAEIVRHEQDGWIVCSGGDAALTEAILQMWHNPHKRLAMGASGRARIEARFSPKANPCGLDRGVRG